MTVSQKLSSSVLSPNSATEHSPCVGRSERTLLQTPKRTIKGRNYTLTAKMRNLKAPLFMIKAVEAVINRHSQTILQAERDSVLVADIGGTNCRFVLCQTSASSSQAKQILSITYATKDYPTFHDALDQFAAEDAFREHVPRAAAFAVAGPVKGNRCAMTNLSWILDGDELTRRHGVKFAILNDFEANGYGVPTLTTDDVIAINDVPVTNKAPKVVMGPGTGLGQANILWDKAEGRYKVWPSEGAHATFAAFGDKQRRLSAYVEAEVGHCEVEAVACGRGLELIYEFLSAESASKQQKDAPAITGAALDGSDPIAVETVDMFLAILGSEAGANSLRVLAQGGVYLCGGILPRLGKITSKGPLLDAFLRKESRFGPLLATFPLFLVKDTGLGIRGCIAYASTLSAPEDPPPATGMSISRLAE